jgi:hypothetical protein
MIPEFVSSANPHALGRAAQLRFWTGGVAVVVTGVLVGPVGATVGGCVATAVVVGGMLGGVVDCAATVGVNSTSTQ